MSFISGTFSCGHDGSVEVYGSSKQREHDAAYRFSKVCPECAARERDARNARNAEKARQLGFPDLIGTEKQVGWANTIRMEAIDKLENQLAYNAQCIDKCKESGEYTPEREASINSVMEKTRRVYHFIGAQKSARWFIENKESMSSAKWMWTCFNKDIVKFEEYEMTKAPEPEPMKEEEILRPDEITHSGVVDIYVDTSRGHVTADYAKDDDFRAILKKLDFAWRPGDRVWRRDTGEMTGDPRDRAAELAIRLIANGFAVAVHDEQAREMAKRGEYEPEHNRWIFAPDDVLGIYFNKDDDIARSAIKRLVGGCYWNHDAFRYEVSVKKYEGLYELCRL